MELSAQILFMFSIFAIVHSYIGYPLSLLLIIRIFGERPIQKKWCTPFVSIIIAAYNEENRINEKIENTLELDYPAGKMQIIIVSDASTDSTIKIVSNYQSKGVKLIEILERQGKEAAQKKALEFAQGDIIIFSDVSTALTKNSVREMVANFSDPFVGCVSSEDKISESVGRSSGELLYIEYEMKLRRIECKANTLVGLSGSFFGIRRNLCHKLTFDFDSDFNSLLVCIENGMRGVNEPKAIGYYLDCRNSKQQFQRRVRTVVRGLHCFFKNYKLLNIFKYRLFSYQFLCHKLLRWCVPVFLLLTFVANSMLLSNRLYILLFVLQFEFYCMALLGCLFPKAGSTPVLKVPKFIVISNFAILLAWIKFTKGEKMTIWQPSSALQKTGHSK
jgi:cellulose synthase/poly-beta-1,6-N-acetylglucosamine synthase-like glycosyltransferase